MDVSHLYLLGILDRGFLFFSTLSIFIHFVHFLAKDVLSIDQHQNLTLITVNFTSQNAAK